MPAGPNRRAPRSRAGGRRRWFVYIVRCADGTLYTGIALDPRRRVAEHNGDGRSGARYTRGRRPVRLVYAERRFSRSAAARREAEIKRLPRVDKEALIGAGRARGRERVYT